MFYNIIKTVSSDYRVLTRKSITFYYLPIQMTHPKFKLLLLKSLVFICIFILRKLITELLRDHIMSALASLKLKLNQTQRKSILFNHNLLRFFHIFRYRFPKIESPRFISFYCRNELTKGGIKLFIFSLVVERGSGYNRRRKRYDEIKGIELLFRIDFQFD